MRVLNRFLLGPIPSWTLLFLIGLGHLLLLFGQVSKSFRQWLMSNELLFQMLYSMFFNAWVYTLVMLAVLNLIRLWFLRDPVRAKQVKKWNKPWASLNLAIVIMVLLGIFTAAGTIVESKFDLETAQYTVYHTWWMYSVLALLCITLFAVMVDRLPWKDHHLSFILAHIGIIILLLGSLETRMKGVDGSMAFEIGQSNRFVTLPGTDIAVYTSFDGNQYTQIFRQEFNVYKDNLKDKPISIRLEDDNIEVIESVRYAIPNESVQARTDGRPSPAVRFQMNNANVNVNEWLLRSEDQNEAVYDFGPAQLFLTKELPETGGANSNQIYLAAESDTSLAYRVFTRAEGLAMEGTVKEGESFVLPWMGLTFRVLRYLPQAEKRWDITRLEKPTPITTSALRLKYKGQEYWLQKNDLLKFFTESAVFIVTFQNRRVDVGFPIRLEEFKVGRYQGTMRAASYSSRVRVPEVGEYTISMNEPLIHNGYTFYQASFQEDEAGNPTMSILSVNQDPGRWEKYLGSFLITLGAAMMFWFKKRKRRVAQPVKQKSAQAVG